jgi:hypothetical protein
MGFEVILRTGPTEEHENGLSVTTFLRHVVLLAETTPIVLAFWLSGAEAPASSVASASCYRRAKNVCILAMIVAELKFSQVER